MKLLTGATGLAGSFIVNEFVQRREPARILVRDRAKAAALEKVPNVEIVEGDMSRRDSLGSALDDVDRVLMISAPRMDMVETQSTFVDGAKAAGVRHVIKFSGLDARPETAFIFGRRLEIVLDDLRRKLAVWQRGGLGDRDVDGETSIGNECAAVAQTQRGLPCGIAR